jgi:hypothetical protein
MTPSWGALRGGSTSNPKISRININGWLYRPRLGLGRGDAVDTLVRQYMNRWSLSRTPCISWPCARLPLRVGFEGAQRVHRIDVLIGPARCGKGGQPERDGQWKWHWFHPRCPSKTTAAPAASDNEAAVTDAVAARWQDRASQSVRPVGCRRGGRSWWA